MKMYIFGSCSGTEPFLNRHHCSFAIETGGGLYWFDAGENCTYTAYHMGVDLLKLKKIVISHVHYDHIGGLGNLLWTVRKLDVMHRMLNSSDIPRYIPQQFAWDAATEHGISGERIDLFLPDLCAGESLIQLLQKTEGNFQCAFDLCLKEYGDGVLFDDGGLRVTALHNHHCPHEEGTPWRSFGFLMEGEGRRIVYTGDTDGYDDYAPLLAGCDLLITETGHHHPPDVARKLLEHGTFPGKLAFIHHGRDFLMRYEEQIEALDQLCPGRYIVFHDGDILDIPPDGEIRMETV